ncbi:MAG: HU family DNA-binding protein [Planctomycetes bacterium]|nr:HU family DNA-binding protein [Planctomycetota bacterium]
MNKSDLVQQVASQLNLTKSDAGKAVEAVIRCIAEGVEAEGKVALSGFGTFRRKQRKARVAVNPLTKREMKIEASKTIGFSASRTLRDKMDGRADAGSEDDE